ncbi:MAG: prephenate dehydrogenase [bacterium]|nr:prephenate dehydrogenase [bacterium]
MIQRIGIIGGTGMMGRMFVPAWEALGKEVMVSGSKDLEQEKALVLNSELVIVSVPIEKTPEVIQRITPWLTPQHLLSDFTSIKAKVIPRMLETPAQVISAHPMFGEVPSLKGHNVILLPVNGGKRLHQMERLYKELGLNVVVMEDWKKHDESMSVIQGLMHFLHITFSRVLAKRQVDLSTILQIMSPVYQANFAFACRILQRDPHLYTHILMDNAENLSVLKDFLGEAEEHYKLIVKKDEATFEQHFLNAREFLGEQGEVFAAQSDYLIEKLKEYKGPKAN